MEKIIKFKGLCCANCAANIERKLNKIIVVTTKGSRIWQSTF